MVWLICDLLPFTLMLIPVVLAVLISRGGVKDTRLETKAKGTKKSEAKERFFWGQTLLRPRTKMLKAKNTTRKCSPKKKNRFSLKKNANFCEN